jgi:hypothetical protein
VVEMVVLGILTLQMARLEQQTLAEVVEVQVAVVEL